MEFDRMLSLLRALWDEGVDYVLVGGAAMNLHGIIRATEDLDLFVSVDHENIETLKRALRSVWDDPEIDEIRAGDLAGDHAVVRYGPPEEQFVIDIIARIGDAFAFEDLRAEAVIVDGVTVRLATPETLYRMKKGTLRPIDRADAATLRDKFKFEEE